MSKQSIQQIHLANTGKISDKWSYYLPYYDKLFEPLQDKSISMLEIGIQNGGSLDTWSNYFVNAKCFIGCDINLLCANLRYSDPRVHVVVGNVLDTNTKQRIHSISPTFDIVIDDGSHYNQDIFCSFIDFFPLLNPGGTYVVEDTHTLYQKFYGGGLLNPLSSYVFFKKLIDVINFAHWQKSYNLDQYFTDFFEFGKLPQFIKDGWVESVEFHDSIITIKKAVTPGHNRLGPRIITGVEAIVEPKIIEIRNNL